MRSPLHRFTLAPGTLLTSLPAIASDSERGTSWPALVFVLLLAAWFVRAIWWLISGLELDRDPLTGLLALVALSLLGDCSG